MDPAAFQEHDGQTRHRVLDSCRAYFEGRLLTVCPSLFLRFSSAFKEFEGRLNCVLIRYELFTDSLYMFELLIVVRMLNVFSRAVYVFLKKC